MRQTARRQNEGQGYRARPEPERAYRKRSGQAGSGYAERDRQGRRTDVLYRQDRRNVPGRDPRPDSRERNRRRAQLRRQRLQARRRQRIRLIKGIAGLALLLFLAPRAAGFISGLGKGISGWFHHTSDPAGPVTESQGIKRDEVPAANQASALPQGGVSAEVLASLRQAWQGKPEAADILAHPENYPDALLELLNKRPETLSFVSNYPSKWNAEAAVDLSGEASKGTLPFLYQWDERWGYSRYGSGIVALSGCGPTCLSMVLISLTGDVSLHPGAVAAYSEEKGYVTEVGTSWELMTLGAEKLGITGEELPLDENRMIRELQSGHPIICSMRPGDFTDTGHFIVLAGYADGAFTVHDPNSIANSQTTWTFERIKGQIKNLWAYSL